MRVELLTPDTATTAPRQHPSDAHGFAQTVDALGTMLASATRAEDAFAAGNGSLQDAMYERARADVALSVATAAAQRTAQALQTVLNMQI